MTEILTDKWLDDFFEIADENLIIKRRETFCIEFKEKFEWNIDRGRSNYTKSLSAFANNKGGALFFGIKNRPHQILGVDNFDDIDDADISNYVNEVFTPHIDFERRTYLFQGKTIGVIYAHKSKTRPIICCKDSSKTFSSDIYYRYGAKSSKIKSGDLITLMSDIRQEETEKWMNLFRNASGIGINNLNVLNSVSGEIIGENHTFLLDENLLKQIKIIDRYSEQDDGEPAIKIIGEIPELTRVITKTQSIYEEDIYKVFLTGDFKLDALEYLKSICHKNTSLYPFYFLLKKMNLDKLKSIKLLDTLKSRTRIRDELIARLEDDKKVSSKRNRFTLLDNSKLGPIRKQYYDLIVNDKDININNENDCKIFFESVYCLVNGEFNVKRLKAAILECYNDYYPFRKLAINYLFRDVLTYIDYIEDKDL